MVTTITTKNAFGKQNKQIMLKTTEEVLKELRIAYSTLYRLRRKIGMFAKEKRTKNWYTEEDVKRLKEQMEREN